MLNCPIQLLDSLYFVVYLWYVVSRLAIINEYTQKQILQGSKAWLGVLVNNSELNRQALKIFKWPCRPRPNGLAVSFSRCAFIVNCNGYTNDIKNLLPSICITSVFSTQTFSLIMTKVSMNAGARAFLVDFPLHMVQSIHKYQKP